MCVHTRVQTQRHTPTGLHVCHVMLLRLLVVAALLPREGDPTIPPFHHSTIPRGINKTLKYDCKDIFTNPQAQIPTYVICALSIATSISPPLPPPPPAPSPPPAHPQPGAGPRPSNHLHRLNDGDRRYSWSPLLPPVADSIASWIRPAVCLISRYS